jgi:HK97 family phage portal protein
MSLLTRITDALGFGKAQSRPQNVAYSDAVMDAFGTLPNASAGMPVNAVSAMRVAAVFACVQKIAGAIATLPLHVYGTDGDIKARLPRDDLWYKLNESPSPMWTAASHWESVSANQLLRGDAYAYIDRTPNNVIRQILPLPNGIVMPFRDPATGLVRYYLTLSQLGLPNKWVEPSDMLHFPGFGFNGLTSMSVISYAARNAVGNAMAMDDYSGKFFANGAHPSMVLTAAGKMNPEQITALQAAFAAKYSGMDNAHRVPLVLTEGLDAKEISINADDAQLLEARKFQVIDIARAFGVPPHMIGETSASTSWGSGIESMSRGFVTYTLQPHLVRIEQELNRKLFPRNTGKFVQFDRDALIEGDSAAQAAYNRAALGGPGTGMGWMSVDEVRKTKGMAPLGGEAAKVFDPNAAAQMAADAAAKAKPDPAAQDAQAAKNRAELTQIANEAQKPTIVNVAAPIVNVTVPEQTAPVVQNTVNVPEQSAPVVNVGGTVVNMPETVVNIEAVMPEQKAPVVNVAAPNVNVEAPTVNHITNVNTPDGVKMEITAMPDRTETSTIARDSNGNITKAVKTEKDAT